MIILLYLLFSLACGEERSDILDRTLQIGFDNRLTEHVDLKWVSASNEEHRISILESGQRYIVNTFAGHLFRVYTTASPVVLVGEYTIGGSDGVVVIRATDDMLSRLEEVSGRCAVVSLLSSDMFYGICEPTPAERNRIEGRRQVHRDAWRSRTQNERTRLMLNREQPKSVPLFTKVGFEVLQLPDELWNAISEFWNENKQHRVSEAWDLGNSYVNHWEISPTMVYLPQRLKQLTFDTLGPLLEEWIGGIPLEPTACYGIRLYHRGSKLENHVDRLDTHAVSAIINVAQDVEEEWPLHIYNNSDVKHEVFIKPRNMVFYESASRIHGRPTPLKGRYYANYFVHFRPRENWPPKSDSTKVD